MRCGQVRYISRFGDGCGWEEAVEDSGAEPFTCGYYAIEAADYNEAVERTMDHPHLEYGGTIEVRQIYGT